VTFLPTPLAPGYTVLPITVFDWASRPQADFQGIAAAAILVILFFMIVLNGLALVIRVRLSKNLQW
jgi:phosphate transport system permease protein